MSTTLGCCPALAAELVTDSGKVAGRNDITDRFDHQEGKKTNSEMQKKKVMVIEVDDDDEKMMMMV